MNLPEDAELQALRALHEDRFSSPDDFRALGSRLEAAHGERGGLSRIPLPPLGSVSSLIALIALGTVAAGAVTVFVMDGWVISVEEVDQDTDHVVFDNDEIGEHFRLVVDSEDTGDVMNALSNGGKLLTMSGDVDELLDEVGPAEEGAFEVLLPDGETGTVEIEVEQEED